MKRLAMPFLLALLSAMMAVPSCSWFQKNPVIPAVVTCSGKTIPIALVTEVYEDVMAEDWIDLATKVVPLLSDGYADVTCILNYLATSNPETVPHIQALKAAHVELRGGTAANVYPKESPAGGALRVPAGPAFSLATSYQDCDARCGSGNGLVVPGGCRCRVGNGLKAHWIAAR